MTDKDVEPTDPTAQLAADLVQYNENLRPIFEQANGMRAQMEADGWSPSMSEHVAGTWLTGAIQAIWMNEMRS